VKTIDEIKNQRYPDDTANEYEHNSPLSTKLMR
jgi:hypothetical protein